MKEEKEREKEKVEEKTKQQAKQKCMYCPYCMNQICPVSSDMDVEYQVNEMYPSVNGGMQYQMNEMYPMKPNMPNWWAQNPYEYKYFHDAWAQNPYTPNYMQDMIGEQYKNPNTQRIINNTSYGCCCNPYGLGRY